MESQANKENEPMADQNGESEHQEADRSVTKEAHLDVPQTPAGRVPLADLIGNGEEVSDQLPVLTPVERVLWNHSPRSMEASSLMTPMTGKSRKRARSSSPPSSGTSRVKILAGSIHASASSRTPHADPAGELWSRYRVSTKQGPKKPSASAAATLMHSSSPRPALAPDSGLRRTMSCGVEWPISAKKRRKIHRTESHVAELSPVLRDTTKQGAQDSRTSRISFLLEQIHDGLSDGAHGQAHQNVAHAGPRDEDGLSEEQAAREMDPLPVGDGQADSKPSSIPKVRGMDIKSSSEFGASSLDLDVFRAMERSIVSAIEPRSEEADADRCDAVEGETRLPESDDEFAAEDGDQLADMELLAAMYDQEASDANKMLERQEDLRSVPADAPNHEDEMAELPDTLSDDEFGGMEDFEEFAHQLSLSASVPPAEAPIVGFRLGHIR